MTFDRIDDMLRPKWPFGPPSPAGGAAGPAGGEPPCPQGGRGPGIQSLGLSTGDCFWRLWRRPRSRPNGYWIIKPIFHIPSKDGTFKRLPVALRLIPKSE